MHCLTANQAIARFGEFLDLVHRGPLQLLRRDRLAGAMVNENALAAIFWQPVPWQTTIISGGSVVRSRSRRQRQPPSQESLQSPSRLLIDACQRWHVSTIAFIAD